MYPIKEHSITQTYKSFHAIMLKDVWENAFFVQLASDVSNQRAQYYANVQKFSHNYVERCLRKCIFCPNGQIVEVCIGHPSVSPGALDAEQTLDWPLVTRPHYEAS